MLVPAFGVQLMFSFLAGGMDSQQLWTLLLHLGCEQMSSIALRLMALLQSLLTSIERGLT